jgi:hypothetical protein
MQQEQGEFYSSLTSQLSADQQNILHGVMVRADEIAMEQRREAEAALAQQQQQVGAPTEG